MTAIIFKMTFHLMSLMPLRWLHGLGALLGRAIFKLSKQYALLTEENLRQSHLANDEEDYEILLRQTNEEAGKGIMELPWVWGRPFKEVCSKVQSCEGWDLVESAHARGKGVIFLTPHWGCFEMTSLYIGQYLPLTNLYSTPKQSWWEDVMRKGRERGLARLATADMSGVRLLYKALKRGEAIGLLPDQVPSHGEGEWADFFSRPAYTMTLSGRLAQTSGASVLMVYAERMPQGAGYKLRFEPVALDFSRSVPLQINAALERVIAVSPAQYLWSYNRYKVPSGALPPEDPKEK